MSNEADIKKNFKENLKAIEYREEIHDVLRTLKVYFEIMQSVIHDVLKSRRFGGTKLLEIGSGATVHNVALASKYFPIIVQSDFVEDNCETLRRWHKNDSPLDWSEFLNMAARFEDYKSDVNIVRAYMESRIRSRVKAVVQCDILKDGILRLEDLPAEAAPPFDLVISILCLEVPCVNFQSFVNVLKRINKLLRKGGGLIISSMLECDKWTVGKKEFPNLRVKIEDIILALDKAGFGNHDVKSFSPLATDYMDDYGGCYIITTEKL